jgi:hypothetical protein
VEALEADRLHHAPMSSSRVLDCAVSVPRIDKKPTEHLIREPPTKQTEGFLPVVTRCHSDPEVGLSAPPYPALCDRNSVESSVDLTVAATRKAWMALTNSPTLAKEPRR